MSKRYYSFREVLVELVRGGVQARPQSHCEHGALRFGGIGINASSENTHIMFLHKPFLHLFHPAIDWCTPVFSRPRFHSVSERFHPDPHQSIQTSFFISPRGMG